LHTRSDDLLKQPSYYAFKLVSNLARGEALDIHVKAPNLETKQYGAVPTLDVSASYDVENQQSAVFVVNRSQTEDIATDFIWQDGLTVQFDKAWQLTGSDPKESNNWDSPERIVAKAIPVPIVDGNCATLNLPPLSFTALTTSST
jgi:alpha-L-arabinofuranosidase